MPASVAHWKFVDASVVLIARVHNPSIINADFLRHKEIVPNDWSDKPENSLATPIVSKVDFGKFQLEVNSDRLILVEKAEHVTSKQFPASDNLYQCAKRYVETLPHIPYVAMGFNWSVHIDVRDSLEWFKKKFLTGQKWRGAEVFPSSFAFKIAVNKSCICTITTVPLAHEVIGVEGNFHFDSPKDAGEESVKSMIAILDNPWGYYRILVKNLKQYFPEDSVR